MTKFARIAAVAAVATLFASPSFAAVAVPAAKAKVNIVKPLTLARVADLDFGTLTLGAGLGTTDVTVSIGTTDNVTCAANVTCTGTPKSGEYKVTGVNNNTVYIDVAASDLKNANNDVIVFTPADPADVSLGNSGAAGVNFKIGGSIGVNGTTPEGAYSGDMDVTVHY